MASGIPMVATDTTTSGFDGASCAASSFPAVSEKFTPWSTQINKAIESPSATCTSGISTVCDPTRVR